MIVKDINGKFAVNIGGHWIPEDDIGEVFRRLKENNSSLLSPKEKNEENEKVLKDYAVEET